MKKLIVIITILLSSKLIGQNFEFKPLPYAYDALEPFIDAKTMEIHYSKHHKTYYENFINSVKGTKAENMSIEEIFSNVETLPTAVRNNGGGYWNHQFFWNIMAPQGKPLADKKLKNAINKSFGSFDSFKEQFKKSALSLFGSGWIWLIVDENKNLQIINTPNQDNPLMSIAPTKGIPILAIDIWEHAYYLKYQNRRSEYIDNWFQVINWEEVAKLYHQAIDKQK
ncbi:MAG TPA: superoxide dismutase [Bacteroidales bacterium]|nr:superoxide dismutase [Bacteroidales bacterium]